MSLGGLPAAVPLSNSNCSWAPGFVLSLSSDARPEARDDHCSYSASVASVVVTVLE